MEWAGGTHQQLNVDKTRDMSFASVYSGRGGSGGGLQVPRCYHQRQSGLEIQL